MIDCTRSSPHFDERPDNTCIKLLVIHCISLPENSFDGPWIDDLFLGRLDAKAHPYFTALSNVRVSAHLLIRRTGQAIQYVDFRHRAWHAGVSHWHGETNCNNFSIGIELEGTDDSEFTTLQYQKLAIMVKYITKQYPAIRTEYGDDEVNAICGHSDIAPDRKTDPGKKFDWDKLYCLIADNS